MKSNEFLFDVGYIVLFIALFLDDIAFRSDISFLVKALKALCVCVLLVSTAYRSWGKRFFTEFTVSLLIGFAILACTGDFFFFIVILLGYNSSKMEDAHIYRLAFYCSSIFLILTLGLCAVGFLPDVLSYRTDFSAEARHSLGFVHSTVLPLILFYMLCYYIAIRKEKVKAIGILGFVILGALAYVLCESRNALAGTLMIAFFALLFKSRWIRKVLKAVFKFAARWITLACTLFAVIPGLLRAKGILMPLWYAYDAIFTNRSLLAASAINGYGIHLINTMRYAEYVGLGVSVDSSIHHGLVLDSAYMYLLIRYGLLILIFAYMVLLSFYKKEKESVYMCAVFTVVILINMTDNDMLSYGCLPFLLIGIKNIWNKVLKRRRDHGFDQRNTQRIQ